MAVLKNKTQNNFTIISNNILRDKELSMKERGVFCTICSLPDGWNFSVAGLSAIVPDGVDSLTSSINKLISLGYMSRTKKRDSQGKFISEIEVFPQRESSVNSEEDIHTGFSDTDNPMPISRGGSTVTDNPKQYKTEDTKLNIKTDDIKSINLSTNADLMDRGTDTDTYKSLVADNIKLDWLLDIANRHDSSEVAMVNEIYDVICDMVCYPRDSVRIKDTTYPWEVVKGRFLKLRYEHIANILNRIVDASLEIKNMSNYLISTLYTESLVGTIDAQASLHDEYLKYLRGKPYE